MPSTAADRVLSAGHGPLAAPPVFLTDPDGLAADVVVLTGREGQHAATVRRLTVGQRADITDGAGSIAECTVASAAPGRLELAVQARRFEPWPDPAVAVAQALPKGDRGRLAVELMTEAGVDVIVPWAAERCVTRWRGARGEHGLSRWRTAAREAAKQARRAWVPVLPEASSTAVLVRRVAAAALAVLLDPVAAVPLSQLPLPRSGEILVIVGPEGGVSLAEAAALARAGAQPARLGPAVLRTSSAGLVAATVILSRCGRWGPVSGPSG